MEIYIYRGYSVEIVETVADAKGNNLKGYLLYNGNDVKDFDHDKRYKKVDQIVSVFTKTLLPKYLKNKKPSISDFILKKSVYQFVKEYILATKITWGYTLDIIAILEERGYIIPRTIDANFDAVYYAKYVETVNRIGMEFIRQLGQFGFTPDRRASDMTYHIPGEKHAGCLNLVFTRYPWTSTIVLQRSVKKAMTLLRRNYLEGVELTTFKGEAKELYDIMLELNAILAKDTIKVGALLDKKYSKKSSEFTNELRPLVEELSKTFATKQPIGYGIYKERA